MDKRLSEQPGGFNEFMANFYHEREAEGFRGRDLEMMPVREYVGFIEEWLG